MYRAVSKETCHVFTGLMMKANGRYGIPSKRGFPLTEGFKKSHLHWLDESLGEEA